MAIYQQPGWILLRILSISTESEKITNTNRKWEINNKFTLPERRDRGAAYFIWKRGEWTNIKANCLLYYWKRKNNVQHLPSAYFFFLLDDGVGLSKNFPYVRDHKWNFQSAAPLKCENSTAAIFKLGVSRKFSLVNPGISVSSQ